MQFVCPHCQSTLEADDSLAGAIIDCPACGNPLSIEEPEPATPEAPADPDFAPEAPVPPGFVARCPHCRQFFRVPPDAAGAYESCPLCGKRFRIEPLPVTTNGAISKRPKRISMGAALATRIALLIFSVLSPLMIFWKNMGGVLDTGFLGFCGLAVLLPLALLDTIFVALLHAKCWKFLPERFAQMTPGKAVALLFVPIFRLYWLFPSIAGLGTDVAACAKNAGLRGIGRVRGLGRALAILKLLRWIPVEIVFIIGGIAMISALTNGGIHEFPVEGAGLALLPICFCPEALSDIIPFFGLLLGIPTFIVWVCFYAGVTTALNRLAPERRAGPSGG